METQSAKTTITQLKHEKQEAQAKAEVVVERIKIIVENNKNWSERRIEESSTEVRKEWLAQTLELQMFQAEGEIGRRISGKRFYIMDEQEINGVREDLTKYFYSLLKI